MLKFAKGGTTPPGGVFFYSDPVNGVPLIQDRVGFDHLVKSVRAAYVAAGKPVPDPLAEVVEAYICNHVPRGFCLGTYSGQQPDFMTPQDVKRRTQEMARANPRADPGTIKSRMPVCGMCPANSKSLCLSCTGMTEWAVGLAGRTRVAFDSSLGVCKYDRVLISLLTSIDAPRVKSDGRPIECWRLHGPNDA